jgi:hypothetical protein
LKNDCENTNTHAHGDLHMVVLAHLQRRWSLSGREGFGVSGVFEEMKCRYGLLDGTGASVMNSAGDRKSTMATGRRENEDGSWPGGLRAMAMAMLLGVQHLLVTWLGERCVSQAREDGRKCSAGGHRRGSKQAVSPALL